MKKILSALMAATVLVGGIIAASATDISEL